MARASRTWDHAPDARATSSVYDRSVLIGVVSADNLELGATHMGEIGYWLAQPYWGQGIMTAAVRDYVRYAFDELRLLRLTAHVLEFNAGSARVLEKNGFKLEGRLRKHIRKDGELLDARFYGLLKEDVFFTDSACLDLHPFS
ncbi:MAG: GNAT family N-acetyltransferase [Pyrinomonadaceae bacterium]